MNFDNKEKELEELSKGNLIYCDIINNQCNKKHCHLCNKPSDNPCCCSDCVGMARDNWLRHHNNHSLNKIKDPDCKFCNLITKETNCEDKS